jgi:glutamine phosphoribosylpyrophosphate amidotransferase
MQVNFSTILRQFRSINNVKAEILFAYIYFYKIESLMKENKLVTLQMTMGQSECSDYLSV